MYNFDNSAKCNIALRRCFKEIVPELLDINKPISYLEIGLAEGLTFFWVVDNILLHEKSKATGVDIKLSEHLLFNVEQCLSKDKVSLVENDSVVALTRMKSNYRLFDIIYVDGGHTFKCVMCDSILSWSLLQTGGIIIFDDYWWYSYVDKQLDTIPMLAIDMFLDLCESQIELLARGNQVVVRKKR